jgi:prophage antirepressor-like protein
MHEQILKRARVTGHEQQQRQQVKERETDKQWRPKIPEIKYISPHKRASTTPSKPINFPSNGNGQK